MTVMISDDADDDADVVNSLHIISDMDHYPAPSHLCSAFHGHQGRH